MDKLVELMVDTWVTVAVAVFVDVTVWAVASPKMPKKIRISFILVNEPAGM